MGADARLRRWPPPALPDLIMLAFTVATQALAPFVPLYARQLGFDARQIGALLSLPGLAAMAASLVAGAWLARAGARSVLVGASVVSTAALLVVWAVPSAVVLVLVLPAFWAGHPLAAVACQLTVVAGAPGQARDRAVGMHAFYSALGVSVGPLVGAAAIRVGGGLGAVFLAAAVVSAAAAVAALRAPPVGRLDVTRGFSILRGLGAVPPAARLGLALVALGEFCWVSWMTFYPLALRAAGLSLGVIGVVFAVHGLAQSALRPAMGWIVARLGRPRALAASWALGAAGLWLAVVPGTPLTAVSAAVVLGVGFGLVFPMTIVLVSLDAEPHAIGRLLAARFFVMMAGGMAGPAVVGVVAAGTSLPAGLALAAAVATAAGIYAGARARLRGVP